MKKLVFSVAFVLIFFITAAPFSVSAFPIPAGMEINAASVILYNYNTDTIVYEKNINEQREPASLAKLMTALVVVESDPDLAGTIITCDEHSIQLISGTGASNQALKAGEQMSALDLLYCTLIPSGCDAANVLATYYGGGSIEAFVEKMNARAKELGMNNTHFVNAHGLSAGNQYSTAADLFLLIKKLSEYENILDICSKTRYTVPATNMSGERLLPTTNLMMDPSTDAYYRYTKGLKTGYTDAAGRCLISIAEKDNQKYLCIMLGCPVYDSKGNYVRREFSYSKQLYEWAFGKLAYTKVLDSTMPKDEVKVRYCPDRDHVLVAGAEDCYAVIPKDSEATLIVETHIEKAGLDAPVNKGDAVGYADIYCAGEKVGTVSLVITEDCRRSTVLFVLGKIKSVLTSRIFLIIIGAAVAALIIFIILNIIYNRRRRKRQRIRPRRRL